MRHHKYQMSTPEPNAPCKQCGQPRIEHLTRVAPDSKGRVTFPLSTSRSGR